jgi:GT2 family glycosyltransferase
VDNSTRVIIINFNAGEALLACVASVLNTREPLNAVVADNQSTDRSCEILRSRYGSAPRLEILENPTNMGFGRAVNACARSAKEPYLLILNPDCELFPDTLQQLRSALEQDPGAALAAPRVVDREDHVMRGTLRHFPDPWRALMTGSGLWRLGRYFPVFEGVEVAAAKFPLETVRADAVSGACMLIRTEQFRSLGGFDESFKMHFEDLDLMARIKQAGKHCILVPHARAFHLSGVSSGSRQLWVHRQKHAGMQRFFRKHVYPTCSWPKRWLFSTATWVHYLLTLPFVLLRRLS